MVKSAFFYEKIIIFQREKAISLIFPWLFQRKKSDYSDFPGAQQPWKRKVSLSDEFRSKGRS